MLISYDDLSPGMKIKIVNPKTGPNPLKTYTVMWSAFGRGWVTEEEGGWLLKLFDGYIFLDKPRRSHLPSWF